MGRRGRTSRTSSTTMEKGKDRAIVPPAVEEELRSLTVQVGELRASLSEAIERTRKAEELCTDQAPFAALSIDKEWRIIDANQAACTLFRKERESIVGTGLQTLLRETIGHGSYYYYYSRSLHAATEGKPVEFETFSPGLRKWLKAHACPTRWGLRLWLRDVSEEKRKLETQLHLWKWQKSVADNSPDVHVRFDANLRCIFANRAAGRTLGADLVGRKYSELGLPSEAANRVGEILRKVMTTQQREVEEFELHLQSTGQTLFFRAVPETDHGRKIGSVLIIGQDITDRRNLEAQLREAQKLEAVGTLSGGIAHDFNNLLAVVLGNSELALDETPRGSSVAHNIENIRTAALRGRDLVRQILAFTRKPAENAKPVPLTPLVKETVKMLRSTIPTSVEIRVETKAVRDAVYGEAGQLQQVLVNLSMNAAQAMTEGGVMTISLKERISTRQPVEPGLRPGDYLALSVKDTGHGIDEKTRQRIFEPFFTTREPQGGTGLGLSVVYGIAKAHEGVVTVRSAPGKGSTFTVFLPIAKTEEDRPGAQAEKEVKGRGRILFVDDEELVTSTARETLSRLGYDVTVETEPKKALTAFGDSDHFDLVVTDHTMPGMSGLDFARALLKRHPQLPIILCTGYSPGVNEETAKAAGVRAFLMKPYTRSQLSHLVAEVIRGPSNRARA